MHYCVEKQVYSWHAKKTLIFDALISEKAGLLITQQKVYIWGIVTFRSKFSHDAPKRCKSVALLRGKANFQMTHQKLLYLTH